MNGRGWTILVIIVVLVGAIVLYWTRDHKVATQTPQAAQTTATFACDGGKSIVATFTAGTLVPSQEPNKPPTPTGSVHLMLSDGRELTLAQTLSADGSRYASADESIVFWNVGTSATFQEGSEDGKRETTNCTAAQ